jgi:hypothetical protein
MISDLKKRKKLKNEALKLYFMKPIPNAYEYNKNESEILG